MIYLLLYLDIQFVNPLILFLQETYSRRGGRSGPASVKYDQDQFNVSQGPDDIKGLFI
jgi:hypothetical protein